MKESAQIAFELYTEGVSKYLGRAMADLYWHLQPEGIHELWRGIVKEVLNNETSKFDSCEPAWVARIEMQQKSILEAIMETQQDLDAGIVTLQADDVAVLTAVTNAGTAVNTSLANLISKIRSNPGAPASDFTAEVAALAQTHTDFQTAISNLQAVAATATTDDPGAQTSPVEPTPTPAV